ALARVNIVIEQRLGRDDEARCAEAALQRAMLKELALDRVELAAIGDAFDRLDLATLRFGGEHEAGADHLAVEHDRAGAAIARAAAFLAAGQLETAPERVEQHLARLAQEIDRVTVDRRGNQNLAHIASPARCRAMTTTLRASTAAIAVR